MSVSSLGLPSFCNPNETSVLSMSALALPLPKLPPAVDMCHDPKLKVQVGRAWGIPSSLSLTPTQIYAIISLEAMSNRGTALQALHTKCVEGNSPRFDSSLKFTVYEKELTVIVRMYSKHTSTADEPLGRVAIPLLDLLNDGECNDHEPLVLTLSPMDEAGQDLRNAAAGAGFLELSASFMK